MTTSSPLFLPPDPKSSIDRLIKLASPRDFIACPFDGAEVDIHLYGGATCPQCGSEFEMGHGGRLIPPNSSIEESAADWPSTLPSHWGSPLLAKAYEALRALYDGGFTLDADLNPVPDLTYVTSIEGVERTIPIGDITANDILSYRAEYADALHAGHTLGGWLDGSLAYLDLSKNFTNLAEAMAHAVEHGQKAVWDEANKFAIPVGLYAQDRLPQTV